MPGGTSFLRTGEIPALPRDTGDSRYPYGREGFNFWACASGYMYCERRAFLVFLRSGEGQEPGVAFFLGRPFGTGWGVTVRAAVARAGPGGTEVQSLHGVLLVAAYFARARAMRVGVRVFVTRSTRHLLLDPGGGEFAARSGGIYLSSFLNPFLRHQIYESGEDRWFKEVRVLPPSPSPGRAGSFLVLVNEDKDRHSSDHALRGDPEGSRRLRSQLVLEGRRVALSLRGWDARGSLTRPPRCLLRARLVKPGPVTHFRGDAIAGDLLLIELGENRPAQPVSLFPSRRSLRPPGYGVGTAGVRREVAECGRGKWPCRVGRARRCRRASSRRSATRPTRG